MLPAIVEPDFVAVLAAIAAMYDGTVLGGPELLLGPLFHVPPRLGGSVLVELANPLKLDGAGPPLNAFDLSHCESQNVTWLPIAALRSPMTKLTPPDR